jgi:hypothetical protein
MAGIGRIIAEALVQYLQFIYFRISFTFGTGFGIDTT